MNKNLEQLNLLETELILLLDNIKRVKEYASNEDNKKWKPYNSLVVGELRHRTKALKQRLTLVGNLVTQNLFTKS